MNAQQKYWITVVSKDHAMRGTSSGFMQACHGKPAPLRRMRKDDWVIFYSPKQTMEGDDKCQCFTAIGQSIDELVYQHKMSTEFIPYRRNLNFYSCQEISILPLISQLDFIQNKSKWGYQFRLGFFEIKENDFNLICSNMLTR